MVPGRGGRDNVAPVESGIDRSVDPPSTIEGMRGPGGRILGATAAIGIVAAIGGCAAPPPPAPDSPTPSRTATATPTPSATPDPLAGMTLEQRVGQLFMVGTPAATAAPGSLDAVRTLHVGGVFLSGRSHAGVAATKAVVDAFTALATPSATAGLPLLVATDQEGGQVQVLSGPGFEAMPSGLSQGSSAPAALQTAAEGWGAALAASGVNMDLAPVVDLIASPDAARSNPPIGGFDRQFGYDPETITSHADAFRSGMDAAGVVTVIKHFPGLGAVTANTDTSSGVTDATTTATSPSVGVFATEIADGAPVVMVSTAIYTRLDPSQPAAFSSRVVAGLLREELGFDGVVISDDLSKAAQVLAWSPADRAVLALQAGVDIVLVSTDPTVIGPMVDAVVAKARSDPAFAAIVDAAARRVIALKQQRLG